MAQGFKPKKACSSTTKSQKPHQVKKGGQFVFIDRTAQTNNGTLNADWIQFGTKFYFFFGDDYPGRTVAPVKPSAVAQKLRKEKVSKSVNTEIEKMVVSKSVGKLSIMKPLKEAEEAKFQKEKNSSKTKPKMIVKK